MFYLLAFNFSFTFVLAFFVHIFIEGPLMNLILAWRIRAAESETRLQENLKLIDQTLRTNSYSSSLRDLKVMKMSESTKEQLSPDYFTERSYSGEFARNTPPSPR